MNLQQQIQKTPVWKVYLPSFGIFEREVRRFFAVPAQTIFAPLGSALIYFALFGLSLGKLMQANSHSFTHGYPYIIFLVPGIMAMETLNGAFQNPISSIMIAKWTGNLVDVLMSPVSPFGLWLAYVFGALIRAILVATCIYIAGCVCAWQFIDFNLPLLLLALIINVGIFASFGVVVGSLIKTFEQASIVTSFILQPLSFFSGVFFSFDSFPVWMQSVKYFNPIFYIVSMYRLAVLGKSDTTITVAFGVSILFFLITFILSLMFLKKGFGLRN
ncbi:MAG: ABC transporter permease [Bdellovibrionota bacterium]